MKSSVGVKVGPGHGIIVSDNLRGRGSTSVSVRVQYDREYAVFVIGAKAVSRQLFIKYDVFAKGE